MGSGQSVNISSPPPLPIITNNDDVNVEDINVEDMYEPVSGNNFDVNATEYFIKKNNKYVSIGQYTGEKEDQTFFENGTITDTFYIFQDKAGKKYNWNSSTVDRIPEQIYIVVTTGGKKTRKKTNKRIKQNKKRNTKNKNNKKKLK
jgi:hypothetical protein